VCVGGDVDYYRAMSLFERAARDSYHGPSMYYLVRVCVASKELNNSKCMCV
jgi:hypothetical protein